MILEVRDLSVTIKGLHILQGVGFDVAPAGVTALLGRNGAGKTTTLRAVTGLTPGTGSVLLEGADLSGLRTHRRIQSGLGYVPEDRCVFAGLTVAENLKLAERATALRATAERPPARGAPARGAAARGDLPGSGPAEGSPRGHLPGSRPVDGQLTRRSPGDFTSGTRRDGPDYDFVFGLFPELAKRARQKAGSLSGGQQQMLALGRVLLNRNRLLLIDEPTKGLAPKVVTEVAEALERVAETVPVLLVEQNLAVVRRLAEDAVVLSAGRVAWTGRADELLSDDGLTKSLLGVGH